MEIEIVEPSDGSQPNGEYYYVYCDCEFNDTCLQGRTLSGFASKCLIKIKSDKLSDKYKKILETPQR